MNIERRTIEPGMEGAGNAVAKEPNLGIKPPQFVKCDKYKGAFLVEAATIEEDFVFHFFRPTQGATAHYWENLFPQCLDRVAREFFKADYPTLQAQRVNEFGIDSWWFRAYGFAASSLDPDALIDRFYQQLAAALSTQPF